MKDDKGRAQELGYPEAWLKDVITSRPDQFKLPQSDATKTPDSY